MCRILDYGKYKYELSKKDRLSKKKQHSFQLKEMRYRPKIDEHDFQFKTKHVRTFVEQGSKVKVFVMFRGREMAYTERGRVILDRVVEELKDVASIENPARLEGRHMTMVIAPLPEVMKRIKDSQGAKPVAATEKQVKSKEKAPAEQEPQEQPDDRQQENKEG